MKKLFAFRVTHLAFLVPLMLILSLTLAMSCFAEEESVKLGTNFDGSTVLQDENGNPKHDTVIIGASATRTYQYDTREHKDFFIDLACDTDCSAVITRLPYLDEPTVRGEASALCSVTGGTTKSCWFSPIAAPNTLVEVTNDEAQDMVEYDYGARATQR